VYFDPKQCSYERLLEEFFAKVDPTTLNRQGGDRGTQYRSVIYYHTPEQKELAEKVSTHCAVQHCRRLYDLEVPQQQSLRPAIQLFGCTGHTCEGCTLQVFRRYAAQTEVWLMLDSGV
jgi:hypothetical protein